mmetsp:Transcript_13414/g.38074  ORF Transcript_13414/g.38074 Transcript_13414/m.38074 type:complete len:483 (-) Transcript_13414:253-1701(-)
MWTDPTTVTPGRRCLLCLAVPLLLTLVVTASVETDIDAINQEGTGREVLSSHYVKTIQALADRQGGSTVRHYVKDRIMPRVASSSKDVPGLKEAGLVINEAVRPTRSQHSSTMTEVAAGVILAAWFGGTWERMGDVGIWTARYVNGTWSVPRQVAWPQPDWRNKGWMAPCWNPVLLSMPGGSTILFYKVGTNPEVWRGYMMRSTDGGLTWSAPTEMGDGIVGPTKNKPMAVGRGHILAGSSEEDRGWTVHLEESWDWGWSWKRVEPTIEYGEGVIQPAIFRTSDGVLRMVMRTRRDRKVVGTSSTDNIGRSWERVSSKGLDSPNAGLDAITLQDGRVLIAHNGGRSGRHKLVLSMSYDSEGEEYTTVAVLEDDDEEYTREDECKDPDDPNARDDPEYSYPSLLQTSDGMLHVTYTFSYFGSGGGCTGRENIKHVVIDPCQLGDAKRAPRPCVLPKTQAPASRFQPRPAEPAWRGAGAGERQQ